LCGRSYLFVREVFRWVSVVFGFHFKERLRVPACRADCWCFFANMNMPAVPAFPDYNAVFPENLSLFQVF